MPIPERPHTQVSKVYKDFDVKPFFPLKINKKELNDLLIRRSSVKTS